jgi:hypothetical protein
MFFNYYFKLTRKLILHPPIRCLFVSFIFLFFFFYKQPRKKDYPNRKFVDIYLLTDILIFIKVKKIIVKKGRKKK